MSEPKGRRSLELGQYASAYFRRLSDALGSLDEAQLRAVADELMEARERDAVVFLMGNGGSAATAGHMVNDLCKLIRPRDGRPFRALSLCDNMPWFSALANDEGYANVFCRQVDTLARSGDLVVGISASGESPNMIAAFEAARARDLRTVAIVGFDGGAMARMADAVLHVPSQRGDYGVVEDAHAVIAHLLANYLADMLKE